MMKDQRGFLLLSVALLGLVLGVALVLGFLAQGSTGLRNTKAATESLAEGSSSGAGVEDALGRLHYEDGFADSLTYTNSSTSYTININGRSVFISITRVYPPDYVPPAPPGTPAQEARITKTVNPTSAPADTNTTYTYTITIENIGSTAFQIDAVTDQLPQDLTYTGPASGLTSQPPQQDYLAKHWVLLWEWPLTELSGSDGGLTSGSAVFTAPSGNFITNGVTTGMLLYNPLQVIASKNNGKATQGSTTLTSGGADFITNGVIPGMDVEIGPKVLPDQTDGQTTAGSPVFTTTTFDFLADAGAGALVTILSGADQGQYTILSVDGANQVTLDANLTATATGVSYRVEYPLFKDTVASVISETKLDLANPVPYTGNGLPYRVQFDPETRTILSVDSESQLTLDSNFSDTYTGRTWEVQSPPPVLQPEESATLTFDVSGSLDDGTHYNEAATDLSVVGCRATGFTAPITVGDGQGVNTPILLVQKTVDPQFGDAFTDETFTYTISIHSDINGVQLQLQDIFDRLPRFFTYVPGSTSGLVTADPAITTEYDQQTLRWDMSGVPPVNPNDTVTLTFQAMANVDEGIYENLYWVTTTHPFLPCAAPGEGTLVEIFGGYDVFATSGGGSITANIRRSPQSIKVNSWQSD